MFLPFLICAGIILTAGPGHLEGGFKAIQDKGAKAAVEQVVKDRVLVDYKKMNG